jgi:hypothetical protein
MFKNLEKDFVVVLTFVIIFSTIEIPFLLVQVLKDGVSILVMSLIMFLTALKSRGISMNG